MAQKEKVRNLMGLIVTNPTKCYSYNLAPIIHQSKNQQHDIKIKVWHQYSISICSL